MFSPPTQVLERREFKYLVPEKVAQDMGHALGSIALEMLTQDLPVFTPYARSISIQINLVATGPTNVNSFSDSNAVSALTHLFQTMSGLKSKAVRATPFAKHAFVSPVTIGKSFSRTRASKI